MYQKIIDNQKYLFKTGITKTYKFRLNALKKLKDVIKTLETDISEALFQDLGKSYHESYLTEIGLVYSEISYHIKHLKKHMKPIRKKSVLAVFPAKSYIYPEPLGTVLIMAPWNYPFQLSMSPLVGAIAAGNTAVIKPSELATATETVLKKVIELAFEKDYVDVVTGGIDETQRLLEKRFDYIFFTGSTSVGKIVMEKASHHLTPVTLELGGKSPAFIDRDIDLKLAAKRIAFGKTINAGQTCIAPDYVMMHQTQVKDFVKYFSEAIESFYGKQPIDNPDYPKMISPKHKERLVSFLREDMILYGGKISGDKIAPTVVKITDDNHLLMKEEIFGPILPIMTYEHRDEALSLITDKEKPLVAYVFTKDKAFKDKWLKVISSGGLVFNDTLMHFTNHHLPFGGVGYSGMGSYHGIESFKTFSHYKSVLDRKNYLDLNMRYHPLTDQKMKLIKKIIK